MTKIFCDVCKNEVDSPATFIETVVGNTGVAIRIQHSLFREADDQYQACDLCLPCVASVVNNAVKGIKPKKQPVPF